MFGFGKKEEKKEECTCGCSEAKETCCCEAEESTCCCKKCGVTNVKVLGSGCKKCHAMYEAAKQAVSELGLSVTVDYVTDLEQVMAYGVMSMPALVVNETIVSMGKVLDKEAIKRYLV
ncbi:MAG: thioredoxin family protein [Bulleidia sp.]